MPSAHDIKRLIERLSKKSQVDSETGCIRWTGAHDKFGFGRVHTKDGVRSAHRLAFTISHGKIPDGVFVRHSCGVRDCMAPSHLYLELPPGPK